MRSLDTLCAELKACGRRMTPQRRAIIQVLLDEDQHSTADHILSQVREILPDISHATVYNTLHSLTQINMLVELNLGLGEHYYDINTADHAHLVCLECGRIEDVSYDCDALTLQPEQAQGFEIIDRRVVYRGYCPVCALSRVN